LNNRTLNSIQINAIGRIYGDNGDEVVEHLARNPSAVLPIVYQRLRQKDQEWRKQKSELMAKWKGACEANYEGSMDYLCYFNRREVERSFAGEQLREECKRPRTFCSSTEKRTGSSASFGLSSPDRSAVLYEPYAVVEMKPGCVSHHFAVRLLSQQVINKASKSKADREKVGRLWTEFIVPFFDYPVHWVNDEARVSFRGELNNFVVQYANGQRVKTAFGEGTILAFLEGNSSVGPRYRVKFPFGIGFVRAYAIMHGIQSVDGAKYVRRDGQMEKDSEGDDDEESSSVKLDKKFRLLFGTDHIYLFLRLYSFLVSSLDEIDSFLRANPTMQDPTLAYYNPMKSSDEKKNAKLDFPTLMLNLQKVISRKLSSKDFEAFCRRVSPEIAHKMAALPKLVDKCADMMVQTAKEDLLLQLFDFCQYPGANPVQLRSACLALSPDAAFRIQYNSSNGRLYFSYLPEGEELSTVPTGDDDDDDDDDEAMEDGEVESDLDDDDDAMDVEDEEEDLRQIKRMKVK
jgi:histone deacetylase complex regulatory component SIN3